MTESREGVFGRHLTSVPLREASVSPDGLKVTVSKERVKDAPNIDPDAELSRDEESDLYRHYELDYTPPATESGRRLARR